MQAKFFNFNVKFITSSPHSKRPKKEPDFWIQFIFLEYEFWHLFIIPNVHTEHIYDWYIDILIDMI